MSARGGVLIAGYYGRRNAGDEAILAGMLAALRALPAHLTFRVVTWNPEATRRLHGVEGVPWQDVPGLIEAVGAADLVIVGGGGLFHDYWGADAGSALTARQAGIAQYGAPLLLARLLGVPAMIYAAGVGPLRTPEGRALTRDLFAAADAACVRDAASRSLLEELGCDVAAVEIVPDPAFAMPPVEGPPLDEALRDQPRPVLGVALRHWAFGVDPAAWQADVAAALDAHLAAHGGTALFVPMQDGEHEVEDDPAVARAVVERMGRGAQAALAPEGLDPLERLALLERCDRLLAMRLHGAVAALRGGVPLAALAYDPKVEALMAQAGLVKAALPPDGWTRDRIAGVLAAARPGAVPPDSGRAAEIAFELLRRGPQPLPPRDAALRSLALGKVGEVVRLEGEVEGLQDELRALEASLLARGEVLRGLEAERVGLAEELRVARSEADQRGSELEEARGAEARARQDAAEARTAWARADGELARLHGSRGFKVLWTVWRAVWLMRERFRSLASIGRAANAALRGLRRLARLLSPRWLRRLAFASGPGAYVVEDNSTVVLYTDREDLFPGYQPRRPLTSGRLHRVAVSLVVTVRNEAKSVASWMSALSQQTRMPDEVIVLDGGSVDDTVDVLGRLTADSSLPIRIERVPGKTIAVRRNLGVRMATHPHIAMTDFGCDPDPLWLERLIAPFECDATVEVVAGGYAAKTEGKRESAASRELLPHLFEVDPRSFLPATRSIAFRREAWSSVGGFPEWLSSAGEDTCFAMELKHSCPNWAFVPEAMVLWHAPQGIAAFWRKLAVWSAGDGESGARARSYVRGLRMLALLFLAAGVFAGGLLAATAGWAPGPWVAIAGAAALVVGPSLIAARVSGSRSRPPFWAVVGLHARSIGYLRGIRNRPAVAERRHGEVPGIRLVLSGVPMDDSGGGQRAAQLAKEWLRRGHLVVFIYRFPKSESVDLRISIRHPRLLHWSVDEFDWEAFRWEYGRLLAAKPVLAVVEFPLREFVPLARAIRNAGGKVVYERIDEWGTSLGGRWYSPAVERRIIAEADALTATAPSLVADLEQMSGRPVLLLPNAVDTHLFDPSKAYERPTDLPSARPIYIYVGSLWGEWFDWDLLLEVARSNPGASVVVIGDYRGQCPGSAPNLHFLGLKPQTDLPAYLAHADVGILPWKICAITQATSPIKVYEYLAMGLPVVAPHLEALPETPLVFRARGHDGFVDAMDQAAGMRGVAELPSAFARGQDWAARVDVLESLALLGRGARGEGPETLGAVGREQIMRHQGEGAALAVLAGELNGFDRPRGRQAEFAGDENSAPQGGVSSRAHMQEVFSGYYGSGLWPGPGSTLEYTENIRREIPRLLRRLGVRTVLDAPCGDFGWFSAIPRDAGLIVIGADIVPELVAANQARYGDARTRFVELDICRDPLPSADLWLCRDCLFHLSESDILRTLRNFARSDIRYLLTSTHPECKANTDIPTGGFRLLNLERLPYSLGAPIERIEDWIEGHPVRQLALWERDAGVSEALRALVGD